MRTKREIMNQANMYNAIISGMDDDDPRTKTCKLLISQLAWVLESPAYELCPECDGQLLDTAEVADLWDGAFWCMSCGKMYKIEKEG